MVGLPNFRSRGSAGLDGAIIYAANFFLDALVGVSSQPRSPVLHYVFDVLLVKAAIARFGDV